MVQVCPDCRSAYSSEVPRFACACGRHDPSAAAQTDSFMPRRSGVANLFQDRDATATAGARGDALLRDIRETRERSFLGQCIARPAPRPRLPRPHDRFDLDDDNDNLPWQHRGRDFR